MLILEIGENTLLGHLLACIAQLVPGDVFEFGIYPLGRWAVFNREKRKLENGRAYGEGK